MAGKEEKEESPMIEFCQSSGGDDMMRTLTRSSVFSFCDHKLWPIAYLIFSSSC